MSADPPQVPFDRGAERVVLATAIGSVEAARRLQAEHRVELPLFHVPEHRALWRVVTHRLETGGEVLDAALLRRTLDEHPDWREQTPTEQLLGVAADVVAEATQHRSVANGEHVDYLRALHLRREALGAAWEAIADLTDPSKPPLSAMAALDQQLVDLQSSAGPRGFTTMRSAVSEAIDAWDTAETTVGLSTAIPKLDAVSRGLVGGQLVVLGARPAMGKSALGSQLGAVTALRHGRPVVHFTMEMRDQELAGRFVANELGGNIAALTDPRHPRREAIPWFEIHQAADDKRLDRYLLWDRAGITIEEIDALTRTAAKRQGQLGLVIVDYIGLIRQTDHSITPQQHLERATGRLKVLASELDTTVLCLAQLNRQLEARPNKRPTLADLRGSGSLEQDADQVWFVYRGEVYEQGPPGEAEIIVAKNRSGSTGTVLTVFDGPRTRFLEKEIPTGGPPLPNTWSQFADSQSG